MPSSLAVDFSGPDGSIGTFRLARIFTRIRLRSMRNAFRVRGRGRTTVLALVIGAATGLAYTGLFVQAFSIIARTVDIDGQLAALALVTGTIAFGSLAARAASSEAVRAGSPENEFLLARPVSLAALVAGRGLADAVTDPVGGLFLLPVLISASVVWKLGAAGCVLAAVISLLMQVGISMLAYAVQLAVVRWVAGRRRRMVWTGLRLTAAMSLAMLWMLGTWVMRAPAALATGVSAAAPVLVFSPAALAGAPLAALARGAPVLAAVALATLAAAVGATLLLVVAVARKAGMAGWEEAGAVWAEATRAPRPNDRLPTAASKDLRLIVRDRSQLLALIGMPVIFIGVQIFGAAGWSWTTASLGRISWLAYSLSLYMATIGPLTHMQAERRAFWILRTVPVPLSHLLAAKARAWAIIVGGIAALTFAVLAVSVPNASLGEKLAAGLLVTAGAAGMSFVAVAMASGGADLSDDTNAAVGPATIYAYMLVGGLFNVVLMEDAPTRIAGLALYAFAGWTYWQSGVEQAASCLDAEVARARRIRASDGATMLIVTALGGRALGAAAGSFGESGAAITKATRVALLLLVGLWAAVYLARRRGGATIARPSRGLAVSLVAGAGLGAGVGGAILAVAGRVTFPLGPVLLASALLAEEIILRGVVQRSVFTSRLAAAAITLVAGIAVAYLSNPDGWRTTGVIAIAAGQALAAGVYALTGRVAAAWVSRVVLVGVAAFV